LPYQSSGSLSLAEKFERRIAERLDNFAELKTPANEEVSDFSFPPEWFHEGQSAAWASHAMEVVAVAGTQGGKTATEAPWLLREVQRCAPLILLFGEGKFIYAGPTLTLMGEQALPAFKDLFEEEEQLGRLIGGNKPKFFFSKEGLRKVLGFDHCPVTFTFAYTQDSSNLESMTALAGAWDEAGQKENKQASYRAFNRRLKVARSYTFKRAWEALTDAQREMLKWWKDTYYEAEGPGGMFGRRFWGTTPYEWGWFKTDVYDKAETAIKRGDKRWAFFNFPSWFNPNISEQECELEREENGMPDWEFDMMYKGLFTRPAGLIYGCFDTKKHICKPFAIPIDWKVFPGGDFGNNNTACVWIAKDPVSETLYVVAEYTQKSKSYKEHAQGMREALVRAIGPHGINPGAAGSHQEDGWREAYRMHGIPFDEPPVNDVETQIGCVYEAFTSGNLIIFDTCVKTVANITRYSRVLDDQLEPTKEIRDKAKFHFADCLRYIISKLRPPKRTRKLRHAMS
jgi:hypothetical protein